MAKSKGLPKTLFVKVERDGTTEYFVADANAFNLVEMGEEVKIGVYELSKTVTGKGIAKLD
jgi:hypothetical protein